MLPDRSGYVGNSILPKEQPAATISAKSARRNDPGRILGGFFFTRNRSECGNRVFPALKRMCNQPVFMGINPPHKPQRRRFVGTPAMPMLPPPGLKPLPIFESLMQGSAPHEPQKQRFVGDPAERPAPPS